MLTRLHPLALLLSTVVATASAQHAPAEPVRWPQFLGPRGSAVVEETGEAPPLTFDVERDLRWKVALPPGSSSPCIAGERMFLTGADGEKLLMLALDRRTGAELWRREREAPPRAPKAHVDADPAAPTPCTDGERVVFYFGEHGLVVTDLDGELLWEKPLPVPEAAFGIGTSPILVDDMVVLSRDGCPDSGVYAFAKEDGAERWSLPRIGFTYSFGTPFVWRNAERREIVVAGTQRLTGLDPKDGKQLWELPGLTTFVCTTPTADRDTLYFAAWSTSDAAPAERNENSFGDVPFTEEEKADGRLMFARLDLNGDGRIVVEELPECRAKDAFHYVDRSGNGAIEVEELLPLVTMPKGQGNNRVVAVAAGGAGDVAETHLRWSYDRGLPYVSSPLLYEGRLYMVKSGGIVTCLDPETGAVVFGRKRLDDHSEYYASPVGVGGHVVLCSSEGAVYVLRAGDEFELVATADLGEPIHATPAVVDGTIYVRSARTLWAFGR